MAIIEKTIGPDIRPSLLLDFANSKTLDPRITFTRSSTATYYDGKTHAKAEENLMKYSEVLSSAFEGGYGYTITANATTAPDGTTTADEFSEDTSTSTHELYDTSHPIKSNTTYTYSAYFKNVDNGYATLAMMSENYDFYSAWFDISTGVVHSTHEDGNSAYISSGILSVGNGWYRCWVTGTTGTLSSPRARFGLWNGSNAVDNRGQGGSYTGTGTSIYAWGFQIEERDSVTAYTPTTSQPITNYIPVLQTAASGTPRFDHDPVTKESKGLLIEEQRTNVSINSEYFSSGSGWGTNGTSAINNYGIAPDGTQTALYAYLVGGTSRHEISKVSPVTLDETYTLSFFAKKVSDLRYLNVTPTSGSSYGLSIFDLQEGTAEYRGTQSLSAGIEDVGNGWYRCHVVFRAISTTSTLSHYISPGTSYHTGTVFTTEPGDDTVWHGVLLWGAQLEEGAFPTSYIPTSGSQVTRSADAASMTGTNFSDWYRQDEGTLYCEIDQTYTSYNTNYPRSVSLYGDNTNTDLIGFYAADSGSIPYYSRSVNITTNGSSQFDTNNLNQTTQITGFHKGILAYKTNDFAMTFDGATPNTDAIGTVPYITQMKMFGAGGYQPANSGYVKKVAYYPERLTNEQLQALTED